MLCFDIMGTWIVLMNRGGDTGGPTRDMTPRFLNSHDNRRWI